MKSKLIKILKMILVILLSSLVFLGIGYLVAIIISHKYNYPLGDVMGYEGLIFILIGVFLSMKGNPSGISLWGIGQKNAQYISYENIEVTRIERESTNYYKNILKQSIVEFTFSGVTMIMSGIFILILSLLYSL